MEHLEGSFEGQGDLSIHWQAWLPEGQAQAKLVISHGGAEHGGRYERLAERLVPAGWAVYCSDHRGHGRSEGRRGQIDRLDYLVADLDSFVDEVAARSPEGSPVMLGHSMGGCVAIAYAIAHQDKLPALALSSPVAVLEAASVPQRLAARALSAIAPNLGVFGVDAEGVSRDPAEVAAYVADPLNYHGKLPVRTVAELAAAVERFPDEAPKITLPLLVMIGTADRIAPPEGGRMIYERASSADKTLKEYEGFFHELINEPEADRKRVLDDLATWLDARVAVA